MPTEHRSRQRLAFAALLVTMLLWAGNAIVGRAVSGAIPPFFLAFCRWAIALTVILPFSARYVVRDRAILVAGWKSILLLGLVGVASFNAFLYSGLHYTTAANASLLQAGIPPLVLLLDRIFFGIRSGGRQIFGIMLSTIGVLIIICQGKVETLLGFHFGKGDLIVLGGVVVWASYTSLLRLRPNCHPLSFLVLTFAIAAFAMFLLAMTEWREIKVIEWHGGVIAAVLYVALFPSVVAYGLFNFAVEEVGGARAGQANNLLPLFGAVLASLLLGERLFAHHLAGMAIIATGIAMSWLTSRRAG